LQWARATVLSAEIFRRALLWTLGSERKRIKAAAHRHVNPDATELEKEVQRMVSGANFQFQNCRQFFIGM
jgi:hypothetical protein